jgi:hypothetical protein
MDMLKKGFALAVMLVLASGVVAHAACTAEEAQAKGQTFTNAAMALAQKDPQKYGEVAQAMQTQLPELQKMQDMDALCKFYDEWTAKMK